MRYLGGIKSSYITPFPEITPVHNVCLLQDITRSNIKSNSAVIAAGSGTAEVAELSWGATDVSQMGSWATPDIVIAADVIYDRDLFNPLLQTFNSYGELLSQPSSGNGYDCNTL